ncbi:MAG TPA: methyltransferase domain-containing protein [Thermopetrobacter sp.]|nr:methyltransferase domain-containing protein [Thermopetrobacter sp.]
MSDDGGLAARRFAAAALIRILDDGATLNEALAGLQRRHDLAPHDKRLAERMARTALRRLGQIDAAIARFLSRDLPAKAKLARAALRVGAVQLMFLRVPDHAAISTAVEIVKRDRRARALAGLVNAVLRRIASQRDAILDDQDAYRLNVPAWIRGRWEAAWGEETARAMAAALLAEPPLDVALRDPASAAHWAARLNATLLPTGALRLPGDAGAPDALPGFAKGAWWVQDAAAQLPVKLLGDVAGRRVLDLCAAPGGKTAQLAAAGARVTALDISARRLTRLRENLARLRLDAEIVQADALGWKPDAPFDAVLLDAPCTATGTARRHPDVLHRKSERQLRELTRLQAAMLDHAIGLVKPGGALVYAVCSVLPDEGEVQIAALLERRDDVMLSPISSEEVGGQHWFITQRGALRTLPHMAIGAARGLDGFFAARLVRK